MKVKMEPIYDGVWEFQTTCDDFIPLVEGYLYQARQ
jgi:hypothetical protein